MYQKKFMDETVALSQLILETGQGGPLGAVVVKDGDFIGRGSNRVTLLMSLKRLLLVCCCMFSFALMAQVVTEDNEKSKDKVDNNGVPVHEIDSAMAFSPDFMPVYYDYLNLHSYIPLRFKPVDTSMAQTHQYNQLIKTQNICQDLGIFGQAHQFINFDYKRDMGFSMITLPYPLYLTTQDKLKFYKLKTSYTNLEFAYGIATQYDFNATHAQTFKGVTIALNMHAFSDNGYYYNQAERNFSADFLLHYEIPSQIYGFTFSYIFNRLQLQDNGGIVNPEAISHVSQADLKGITVNSKYGKSKIRTHNIAFQQYVNLLTKNKKYLGTITHSFQFKQLRTEYFDRAFDSTYYQPHIYLSPDTTFDTVQYYSITNSLQWSNFKPLDTLPNSKYFFRIAGGVMHEYVNAVTPKYIGNSFYLFARTHIRFFGMMDVYGKISYAFGGYNANDVIASAGINWQIQKKLDHYLGVDIAFYRNSPDFIYQTYYGNHNMWYNLQWPKQNTVKLGAVWSILNYKIEFNYFMLQNLVRLNQNYEPFSVEKASNVIQFHFWAPIRVKGFGLDINAYVQYTESQILNLPIFALKASPYYIFNLIKNKLKLQIGMDLMYNTAYYADGYDPILHQFYYQNDQKVGNYCYLDANITLKIKRIAFFFRAGHFLSGVINYDYFRTPNYPALDRRFQVGITWKFYD